MIGAATRIINRPSRGEQARYRYEFEVAKYYGYSSLNDDETFVHVGYFNTQEEAEDKAKEIGGIVLHRTYMNGAGKQLKTKDELSALGYER